MKKIYLLPLIISLLASTAVSASAIAQLNAFIANSKTLSARFQQTVSNKNGAQQASGTLLISRPGKFRWEYKQPYEQLIVGDGKTLWIYDKDLNQATRRSQNTALGSSPAALLAGNNTISQHYSLKEDGTNNQIEWLLATPKHEDNTFSRIRMGFSQNQLVQMSLIDSFGNTTTIQFDAFQKNPVLSMKLFQFTPPKDADIVSGDAM